MEPSARFEEVKIPLRDSIAGTDALSGVLGVPEWWPTGARVGIVLAHGQSATMADPLIEQLQQELTQRKFLTLRFNFPFAEVGRKRPDNLLVLERAYRAAIAVLGRDPTSAPAHLFLGGKNLGARVAAQLGAAGTHVDGFFFLGFPLHRQDKPKDVHAEELFRIISPMLFVQGTHDRSCDLDVLRRTLGRVGAPTTLHLVEEADHGLRVAKKFSRTPEEVRDEVRATLESWIEKVLGG